MQECDLAQADTSEHASHVDVCIITCNKVTVYDNVMSRKQTMVIQFV